MARRERLNPPRRIEPKEVGRGGHRHGARGEEALAEAREQRLERIRPTRQQHVQVIALRDPDAGGRRIREEVALG